MCKILSKVQINVYETCKIEYLYDTNILKMRKFTEEKSKAWDGDAVRMLQT